MSGPIRTLRLTVAAFVVAGGLIVASCSNGNISTTPVATATATSAPVTQSIPGTGSLNVASSTSQVASIGFTGAPAGITITATSSATAPSGAPGITSLKRAVQSISGAVPFFYVTFSLSANLSSSYITSESVTLTASDPTNATYGAAFDDITSTPGTELGTAGPGTISNGVVTIVNGNSTNAPTLQAGHTYLVQFFYVPAASPSPSPTASASAGPSSSPSASPSSSPSGSPSSSPSPGPSASSSSLPLYTFGGGTDTTNTCSPTNCAIPIYIMDGPLTFQAQFNAPNTTTVVTGSAATASQISPSGFPFYTSGGTVEIYVEITGTPAATFPATPTIGLAGLTNETSCIFYGYDNNTGTNYSWTQIAPATGSATVTSGSVTFQPVTLQGGVQVNSSPFYGAVVCSP
jgi:hypothetical protein